MLLPTRASTELTVPTSGSPALERPPFIALGRGDGPSAVRGPADLEDEYDGTSRRPAYQLSETVRRKYDVDRVVCYTFEARETLAALQHHYKEQRCEPNFIRRFLELGPCVHRRLAWQRSELYDWNQAGDWVTMPNPKYCDIDQLASDPTAAKDNPGGFGLVGWFVHPDRLATTPFADPALRSDDAALSRAIASRLQPDEDLELGFDPPGQPVDGSVEDNLRVAEVTDDPDSYLATILDLDASHIGWLRDIKARTLDHLESVYGVDPDQDQVLFYFHFPYVEKSATLHLHVRVNQGVHPTEQLKSFHLDEIIDTLTSGRDVIDLVLARQRLQKGIVASSGARAMVEGVRGARAEWIDNPYRSATQHGIDIALGGR